MSITRKVTAAIAVIALAGVGGYGAARALSTDGPDPSVDSPVVVRPANDSSSSDDGDRGSGKDSRGKRADDRGDDRGKDDDDRGKDDRNDDSGHGGGDDDLEPAHPTPNEFDDDDDSGGDDDGGDDDGDDGDDGGDDDEG